MNGGLFFLYEAIEGFLKRFDLLDRFSPFVIFDFGFQGVFVHTQNLYFVVQCIPLLDWLGKSKNTSVIGMIGFGCGYWIECGCIVLLCVSLCPLVPCGNCAQLGGGSGAERVMSTLAYGWVERCSNIASCGEASSQDKYSCILPPQPYSFMK